MKAASPKLDHWQVLTYVLSYLSSRRFCNHFVISPILCSRLSEELKTFSKVLKTFSLAEGIYELHVIFWLLFTFENSNYRLSFQMEFLNTVY